MNFKCDELNKFIQTKGNYPLLDCKLSIELYMNCRWMQ